MKACVIGAGSAGLVVAKHLLEAEYHVDILEKRDDLGGLWYFDPAKSTVAMGTIASSSKTFLQFSDFPMEADTPYFPHHSEYLSYLHAYAVVFNLKECIQVNTEVTRLRRKGSQWQVTLVANGQEETRLYDVVAVCAGLHQIPLMPTIEGQEAYDGEIIHSSLLKSVDGLAGQNVVVIGGGENGADVVHEAAPVAKHVYMSLRRGMAVTKHYSFRGLPGDYDSVRAKVWLPRPFLHDFNVDCRLPDRYSAFKTLYTLLGLPFFLVLSLFDAPAVEPLLKNFFTRKTWDALFEKPQRHGPPDGVQMSAAIARRLDEIGTPQDDATIKQRAWELKYILDWYSGAMHNSQPFTKRTHFMEDVVKRTATIVPAVRRLGANREVVFDDGRVIQAETIVMCTGFQSDLPFLENQHLDGRSLYKNVFLPNQPNLGFIGFARPNVGALPPVAEMQARWFVAVLTGRHILPDAEVMQAQIKADAANYTYSRPTVADRLTSLVDYHRYMEEIAGYVGCRPNVWHYWKQPRLLYRLLFAPMANYQYRLEGYGARPKLARRTALQTETMTPAHIVKFIVLYFIMKPLFRLLAALGYQDFKPLF